MQKFDVVIIGWGTFGRSLFEALRARYPGDVSIAIVSRGSAARRSAGGGLSEKHDAATHLTRYYQVPSYSVDALRHVLCRLRSQVLVVCASPQSPREAEVAPSRWTKCMQDHYAVTALLHLTVPLAVAIARGSTPMAEAVMLNACYPDLVNAMLKALGYTRITGLGNVGILSDSIAERGGSEKLLVGHHWHLRHEYEPEDGPLFWDADAGTFRTARTAPVMVSADEIYSRAAAHSAKVIGSLVDGPRFETSLPGPHGLVGGYPVVVDVARVDMLPEVTAELPALLENNIQYARREGMAADADVFSFEPALVEKLARPELAGKFTSMEFRRITKILSQVRRDMRAIDKG